MLAFDPRGGRDLSNLRSKTFPKNKRTRAWPCFPQRDSSITGISSPYAWLSMEVAQVTDSLEEITEIDPLNIAEILGNIGGFWGERSQHFFRWSAVWC